ncbi:hypothetical protein TRVL_04125 [Trypanosoma vivax]|nr:hypothetical protein TRVL_04125 [Trypanosoma vivax]
MRLWTAPGVLSHFLCAIYFAPTDRCRICRANKFYGVRIPHGAMGEWSGRSFKKKPEGLAFRRRCLAVSGGGGRAVWAKGFPEKNVGAWRCLFGQSCCSSLGFGHCFLSVRIKKAKGLFEC